MTLERSKIAKLAIISARPKRVADELDTLIAEWQRWQEEVAQIKDHAYDENRETAVFKDGRENMEKHAILQEKTWTFVQNNIEGHGFIVGRDGQRIDRDDLRLKVRVEHRLRDLRVLRASLEYAILPESYWKEQGKKLLANLGTKATDAAVDLAASALKDPSMLGVG